MQAHNKIKTNMAGLQCFGCGQGFGFFRREVSFTFLLWMKTLRRFIFHDIFCEFLYERWPVSGLQKLNFFVSSLLKSRHYEKFTFAVQFCNLLLHKIQLCCTLCQDLCILPPNSVPHFCGQFDRYQDICFIER